ncbi:unnamed protein product [Fusarium fujikuroi]|nr:unnamed protein product [Fusarium fujikuroi]
MPNISPEPEALISCASHRPRHLLEAMITIPDAEKPKTPTLAERVSSLGILDRLPLEILYMLLGRLDIQSITSFVRVSFRGNSYIESLRAYRDLVTFAPQTLMALGKTGLLNLHSVTELHAALRQERCASCVEYGAFLFLPTCERCCWECLRHNPLLRVLPSKEAKRYFGLSERHIRQLPTISVIPSNYGISRTPSPRSCRLGNIPTDKFFGMASIPFPSLSASGRLENGLWCRGCEITLHHHDSLRLPRRVLAALVPRNRDALLVLLGLERRAWSTESFLEHIKHWIIHDDGHYRLRTGRGVRYLRIPIGTFDDDTMCRPYLLITRLPELPDSPWTAMTISQDENGSLTSVISMNPLPEIRTEWHEQHVDVLTLKSTRRFRSGVHEVRYNDVPTIAKIACFEWEMRRIEREMWAYSLLEDHHNQHPNKSPIVSKFLAHLTDNGRTMGLLLEKVKGSRLAPTIRSAAKPYFAGFIVTLGWSMGTSSVRLVDFEHTEDFDELLAREELLSLPAELTEETGREATVEVK